MTKHPVLTGACVASALLGAALASPLGAEEKRAQGAFVPVDTSRLMGTPDAHPSFGVERAFPHLRFTRPVDVAHSGDGSNRLFAVEQDGRVRVFTNDAGTKNSKVFLDLSDRVRREHNEEGLLGIAFHPKYRKNGEFFVFYSVTPCGTRVSRLRVSSDDPNVADPESEEVVLEFRKPYGNHNGGSLHFGPDGFLYVSIGDGGLAHDPHGNGQNLETLFGSILRIDVDHKDPGKSYAIPKDNPFVDRGPAVRGEIFAYGLRNPWRIAFDRVTGTLWAGDVGQDQFEEVDIITRGGNYGWNLREGKHPRDPKAARDGEGFIDPVFEYPRVEGKSITGGVVYRGERLPSLRGSYLFADFVSGNIWALERNVRGETACHKIARTSLLISSFGEDEAGEVYFTAFDGGIHRLRKPVEGRPSDFPQTLTETGLFSSVKDHQPSPGLIPYDVNVPLWSDGALKERFLALPQNGSVVFKEKDQWELPVGAVIVKTFLLQTDTSKPEKKRRLETRLWLHSPRGWEGYTYMWNEDQSEAHLLADWPFTREFDIQTPKGPVKQEWYFPSRSNCQACHTHNVGFVLGWNTRQLNRPDSSSGEGTQIDRFRRLKLFTEHAAPPKSELEAYPDWNDERAPLDKRARAYLDVNCALCHSPGGFGMAGGSKANLNFHRPFQEAFAVPAKSTPDAKRWIVPGQPDRSLLIHRMQSRSPKDQMPPLATHRVDQTALDVLRRWIEEQTE